MGCYFEFTVDLFETPRRYTHDLGVWHQQWAVLVLVGQKQLWWSPTAATSASDLPTLMHSFRACYLRKVTDAGGGHNTTIYLCSKHYQGLWELFEGRKCHLAGCSRSGLSETSPAFRNTISATCHITRTNSGEKERALQVIAFSNHFVRNSRFEFPWSME